MIDEIQFEKINVYKNATSPTVFVHNCFASMFNGMLNWVASDLYPRFQYKTMSTYDKAVEFFSKKKQSVDGQIQTNVLPCVSLDPILDFSNEERAGRFLWMFENLDPYHGKNLFPYINLRDQGISITPIFTRYQGTAEMTFWFTSVYELMDFRVKLIQYCGGYQRWIRPKFFWTHLILPDEIVNAKGPDGDLDWSHTNRELIKLESVDSKCWAYPFNLNSIWRLDSFADASNKMGADLVSEWKLTATFTWEAMIPTFLRIDNYDYNDISIQSTFGTSTVYTAQPLLKTMDLLIEMSAMDLLEKRVTTFGLWNIDEPGATPIVKLDNTMCQTRPWIYGVTNHYVCGKLLDIEKLNSPDDITDFETVLLIPEFDSEYIPYLRRCKGAISRDDTSSSEFYTFCNGLDMSIMFDLQNKDIYEALKKLHGKDITFDPIGMMIYSGKRNIKHYQKGDDLNNFVLHNNLLKILEYSDKYNEVLKKHNKLQLTDSSKNSSDESTDFIVQVSDTSIKEYELPYVVKNNVINSIDIKINDVTIPKDLYSFKNELYLVLDDSVEFNVGDYIYLVKGARTTNKKMKLYTNYSITRQDERNYYSSKTYISIDVPEGTTYDQVVCCSYMGKMAPDVDFVLKDNKLYFNIEPMRDRIIQVFLLTDDEDEENA